MFMKPFTERVEAGFNHAKILGGKSPQLHHILLGMHLADSVMVEAVFGDEKAVQRAARIIEHECNEMGIMTNQEARLMDKAKLEAQLGDGIVDTEHLLLAFFSQPVMNKVWGQIGLDRYEMLERISHVERDESALEVFTTNLTEIAADLDPVIGRDEELSSVIRVLARRKKPNPALIGYPGIGKSAIVIGLAQRIKSGDVPEKLKGWVVRQLDLAKLMAGTSMAGELEKRLYALLNDIRKSEETIVLFVDEFHKIVGGGGSGSQDIANIMKPALADGSLKVIGATTIDEYREYIEKDGALERRFQPVYITEPTPEQTLEILMALRPYYGEYHGVTFSAETAEEAVRLATRYITERRDPDRSIDLMDEASATVSLTSTAKRPRVTPYDVCVVVSRTKGIPLEKLTKTDQQRVKNIEAELATRIIGQADAVRQVSDAIRRAYAGLELRKKPIGSFLFIGPTGVGKTELARTLAWWMFDDPHAIIKLDMSEYQEPHSMARLFGAPPGYVGHERGGQLTEPIRRRPFSVVLLDEIEKAHPEVWNTLLQVMDDGRMTDGMGRVADFTNAIIIMTSNACQQLWRQENPARSTVEQELMKEGFRPEFLNRFDGLTVFNHLSVDNIEEIARLRLDEIAHKVEERGYSLEYTPEVARRLAELSHSMRMGARPLIRQISTSISDQLALQYAAENIRKNSKVKFDVLEGEIKLEVANA